MTKSPTFTSNDETGFTEPTSEQQDQMVKAPGPWPRRWSPRSGKILEAHASYRTATATSVPNDAAGAQTITDGSFVKDQR
jgi:hypothetical protein